LRHGQRERDTMVKIFKRPLPDGFPIRSERDLRSDTVFERLLVDCRGKCYICEDSTATTLQVEHRAPHRGDKKLKYDWDNL